MSERLNPSEEPNLRDLALEMAELRSRVEDLEDARDLDAAIRDNGNTPLVPWDEAKQELDLD